MNQTGINWADRTWNPMTGCLHGCTYCYARQVAELRKKTFPQGFEPVFHVERLALPGKVKAPQIVLVGSMTDMMGEWWPSNDIGKVMVACAESPHHTFLWLTKKPGRYYDFIWPGNCWLGTTITNQADADERIPALLRTPDVKRFLSIEPMLESVDLTTKCLYPYVACTDRQDDLGGMWCGQVIDNCPGYFRRIKPAIHQVILGGQTGRDAKPMHPDWVRSVRDQCAAAGVPFFFKSWGEWKLVINQTGASYVVEADEVEKYLHVPMRDIDRGKYKRFEYIGNDIFIRVGKKAAGRLLDGREHNDLAWRI